MPLPESLSEGFLVAASLNQQILFKLWQSVEIAAKGGILVPMKMLVEQAGLIGSNAE